MKLFDYIKNTKAEMRHVSWPTKTQTFAYTLLVIVISVALSFYLGIFDYIFTNIINRFFI